MKIGRKSTFSEELGDEICHEISVSPRMLEDICKEKKHWPCAQTIYEWRLKYEQFGEKYKIAKQCQIEPLLSHALNLVRDKENDFYEDKDGKKCNSAHLQRLKVEVDLIKWLAGKLAPKIYGECNVVKITDDAISTFRVEDESK